MLQIIQMTLKSSIYLGATLFVHIRLRSSGLWRSLFSLSFSSKVFMELQNN